MQGENNGWRERTIGLLYGKQYAFCMGNNESIAKVKDNTNEDKNVVEMNVSDPEQYLKDITSIVETSLEKIVGDKLNIITAQLENSMATQLSDKIKELDNQLNNTIQQSISYADKVKNMSETTSCQLVRTFKSILQETKN